ncbi:hypothetical protein ABE28_019690 [Peribacillus muralis]|uniref:Uncharacterized protein n=1 Tax=Peribacillus muralis TaxID=264697 RepID=A0A1B3XTP7_9BACI|nr:hypothetical protein [Peribacillus muralis]AOH56596.1 hypothetical protein ABE28_019690 [Peribacillus muralis]
MKVYKIILVAFSVGLLYFMFVSIYEYTRKGTDLFTQGTLLGSIGVFLGAIPLLYYYEYQKKKDKNKFDS